MKNRIRIARGTKAQINDSNTNIPVNDGKVAAGVPIYTTDEKKLYISDGTQKPSDLVGINASGAEKLININSGVVTNQSTTDGKLMYIDSSDGKAKDSSISKGTGIKPIYMDNGEIKESDSTLGSDVQPVYMNNGEITKMNKTISERVIPQANMTEVFQHWVASNHGQGGTESAAFWKDYIGGIYLNNSYTQFMQDSVDNKLYVSPLNTADKKITISQRVLLYSVNSIEDMRNNNTWRVVLNKSTYGITEDDTFEVEIHKIRFDSDDTYVDTSYPIYVKFKKISPHFFDPSFPWSWTGVNGQQGDYIPIGIQTWRVTASDYNDGTIVFTGSAPDFFKYIKFTWSSDHKPTLSLDNSNTKAGYYISKIYKIIE